MSNDKEQKDKSDRAEEIRVLEVRRTIRAVQEDVKSERLVFHLIDGEWKFHTAGAYDFDAPTLRSVIEQLERLTQDNPDKLAIQ